VDHFISEAEFPPAYKSNLWQRLNDPAYVFLELAPRGWVFQNMANVTRKYQQLIKCFDPARGILEPQKYAALSSELQSLPNHRTPYTFLVATMVPNYTRAAAVTAHHQARVDMALIACALERHRLRLGHYPATLAALMPEFLSRIPNDIIGGQPFRYQASNDQRFRLYSIGWNEVDDGGVPTAWSSRSVKGDWTWEVSN
jgi:hypothetical protein